jgi:hypothetical protein
MVVPRTVAVKTPSETPRNRIDEPTAATVTTVGARVARPNDARPPSTR